MLRERRGAVEFFDVLGKLGGVGQFARIASRSSSGAGNDSIMPHVALAPACGRAAGLPAPAGRDGREKLRDLFAGLFQIN